MYHVASCLLKAPANEFQIHPSNLQIIRNFFTFQTRVNGENQCLFPRIYANILSASGNFNELCDTRLATCNSLNSLTFKSIFLPDILKNSMLYQGFFDVGEFRFLIRNSNMSDQNTKSMQIETR